MTLRQNDGVAIEQQLDVSASMELSDAQMEGVAGGIRTHVTGTSHSSGTATVAQDDKAVIRRNTSNNLLDFQINENE